MAKTTVVFTLDGIAYNVSVQELKRSFSVLDSDKSGRSLNGSMVRDVIGTFYNYKMTLGTSDLSRSSYNALYEAISAPVDSHLAVFPYGDSVLSQRMYITSGEDGLFCDDDGNTWSGLSLNFIAMEPQRVPGE